MDEHARFLRLARVAGDSSDGRPRKICASRGQRGLILVVVLVMIALLSLLAASFTFMVRANLHAAMAAEERFQARLAAESGIQRAIVMLRQSRNDPGAWYDNPAQFKGWLVYGEEDRDAVPRTVESERYDPNARPAWRFNLVAPNYDAPNTVRYGITDECSKLNLNTATAEQLYRLFATAIPQDQRNPVNLDVLVDSLLDWREAGDEPRPNGAKNEFYQSQRPPYRCKGGPFSTIEELLLVRGFNGWVLFGEDYNRNGLLDPNEDDGEASFPMDDSDGVLFAGVAPYLTLWSRETNASSDGRPRINLNLKDTQKLQEQLAEQFSPEIISYVLEIRGAGLTFNSVMNLLPAPPPPEPEEPTGKDGGAGTSQPGDEGASASQPASQPTPGIRDRSTGRLFDQDRSGTGRGPPAPVYRDLTQTPPPGTYADLPLILDRLTVHPQPMLAGRINISTAPLPVLATLVELSEEEVGAIVEARAALKPEERTTAAWLLQRQVIDENKFRRILDKITTGCSVFQIESVGYGDHVGVVERLNVILEMRGPVPQVLYTRNLSALGPAYTPHGLERRGPRERTAS